MQRTSHDPTEQTRYAALMNHRLSRSVIGDAKSVTLVTEAAARFGVPLASIGLVGRDKVHLVAEVGTQYHVVPRESAFSTHAIARDAPLVIEDAAADPSFASHPVVVAGRVRFVAAAPLIDQDGYRLGAFCLLAPQPRRICASDIAELTRFAARAMARIDFLSMIAELSRAAVPVANAGRKPMEAMVW